MITNALHGSASTISKCLDCIMALTYPLEKLEVVVVDDGSLDKTAEIVKNYPVKLIASARIFRQIWAVEIKKKNGQQLTSAIAVKTTSSRKP